jgi:DNA repair exonuclease SbcCD nuclease subunit
MVKVGVFADTHVGRSIPNIIAEHRRQAFRHAFTQAINVFIEEGVDLVVHAGDLFERRSMKPSDSLFVKEELQRLVDSLGGDVRIIMVRGNHDGTAENNALNYVQHPLAKYLTVLGDKTLQGEPEVYQDDSLAIVGFGYTPFASIRLNEVKDAVKRKYDDLKVDNKIFLVHAFIEGQEIPPNVPEYQAVSLDLLKELGADLIVAGHHHKYLPLVEKSGLRLLTPGATEAVDLSDDSPHGVCVLKLGQHIDCKFVPVKPLHKIKNVVINSGGAIQQPTWFVERASEVAQKFSEDLKAEGEKGILRIALRGFLDGNRFDLEAELEKQMQKIREESPQLLHVEIDNDLSEIAHARVSVSEYTRREEFLQEVFKSLGEKRMAQALSLAEEVRMALEERASDKTGLLRESDRRSFVEKWLKILEAD